MSIKALFLDLDGTSLNEHHELSLTLIKILTHLRHKGIEVVFSTGRSFASSQRFAHSIGGCNYIINYNGARIYDFSTNTVLKETTLPSSIIKQVFDFSEKKSYPPIFYHNNTIFTNSDYEHTSLYVGETFKKLDPNIDWSQEALTKALFVIPETDIDLIRTQAISYFDKASVYTSAATYLEIMPKGINKGQAVQYLLDKLAISPDECVAFGDQLNDLEMLKLVKHGFVMENAALNLQDKLPSLERALPNHEDGVAKKLSTLFDLNL